MDKITIRRRTHDGMIHDGSRDMHISLPAPPFSLDLTNDRTETNPTFPMVKCAFKWQHDPTLRHAAKIAN